MKQTTSDAAYDAYVASTLATDLAYNIFRAAVEATREHIAYTTATAAMYSARDAYYATGTDDDYSAYIAAMRAAAEAHDNYYAHIAAISDCDEYSTYIASARATKAAYDAYKNG